MVLMGLANFSVNANRMLGERNWSNCVHQASHLSQMCYMDKRVTELNCGTVVGHIFVHIDQKNVMIWTKCGLMVVKVCNVHQ